VSPDIQDDICGQKFLGQGDVFSCDRIPNIVVPGAYPKPRRFPVRVQVCLKIGLRAQVPGVSELAVPILWTAVVKRYTAWKGEVLVDQILSNKKGVVTSLTAAYEFVSAMLSEAIQGLQGCTKLSITEPYRARGTVRQKILPGKETGVVEDANNPGRDIAQTLP